MKGCLFLTVGVIAGILLVVILLLALKPKSPHLQKVSAGSADVKIQVYEPYLNAQLSNVLSSKFSNYVESSSLDVKPNRLLVLTIKAKVPKELGQGLIGSIAGILSQVQGGNVNLQVDSVVSVSGGKLLVKVKSIRLGRLPVQRGMLPGAFGQMIESAEREIDARINEQIGQAGLEPFAVESDEKSLTLYLRTKNR